MSVASFCNGFWNVESWNACCSIAPFRFWYQDINQYMLIHCLLVFCLPANKADSGRQTHACFPIQKSCSQNKFKSSAVNLSTTSHVENKGWKKINKNGPSAVTGKTPEGKLGRKGIRKIFKCSFLFYCVSNPIFLASLCLALLLFVASLHVLKAL